MLSTKDSNILICNYLCYLLKIAIILIRNYLCYLLKIAILLFGKLSTILNKTNANYQLKIIEAHIVGIFLTQLFTLQHWLFNALYREQPLWTISRRQTLSSSGPWPIYIKNTTTITFTRPAKLPQLMTHKIRNVKAGWCWCIFTLVSNITRKTDFSCF